MYKKIIFSSVTSLLICSFAFLLGCGKSPQQLAVEKAEVDKTIAANKAYEEAHKPRPTTDPSLCKNNPEGYLYFTVGKEVFRSNTNSVFLIIAAVPEFDKDDNLIVNTSEIPQGCEGNPYKKEKLLFKQSFIEGRDDLVKNLDIGMLGVQDVPGEDYESIAFGSIAVENFEWDKRNQFVDKNSSEYICEDINQKLTHCVPKVWGLQSLKTKKSGLYISNKSFYSNIQNLPFALDCQGWVVGIKCDAFYRLYPTVNLEYSIKYKDPEKFDATKILLIDEYIQRTYEAMRVKH